MEWTGWIRVSSSGGPVGERLLECAAHPHATRSLPSFPFLGPSQPCLVLLTPDRKRGCPGLKHSLPLRSEGRPSGSPAGQLQFVGAPLTLVQVLLVAQGLSEMVVPLTAMF